MSIANIIPALFFITSCGAVLIISTGDTVRENIESRGYKMMDVSEWRKNEDYWKKVVNLYKDYPFDTFTGIELDDGNETNNITRLKSMCREFSDMKSRSDKKYEYLKAVLRWCTKSPTVDEILTKQGYIAKGDNELSGNHTEKYLERTTIKESESTAMQTKTQEKPLKEWCKFRKEQIISALTPEYHFKDIKEKCYTPKS